MIFKIIHKYEDYLNLVANIEQSGEVVVDLETTSLKTHSKDIKIVGSGFCYNHTHAYYIPFNDEKTEIKISDLSLIVSNENIGKIGHNIKYDARVFNRFGIEINNIIFDTLLASYCLYGDRTKHNLDDITLDHFNHVKIRTKDVIPRKSKRLIYPTMLDSPVQKVAVYCNEDVYYTYKLYRLFKVYLQLPEFKAANDIFYNIELPLLPVLIEMECNGAQIDKQRIIELNTKLNSNLEVEKKKAFTIAGKELVFTNPTEVSTVIFESLKVHEELGIEVKKTATGKYKTDKNTLEELKAHPFVESLINIKKLNKLIGTYMESFPTYISDYTDKLHTYFNQTVTATGRLSSSEPNLQNQPQRDQLGKEIRCLYVSRWKDIGGKILAADYSQAELRILAHMSNEPVFIDIFNRGADAHLGVASKIFNKPENQITPSQRTFIKTINFGLLYGMGPKKLAASLKITVDEAKQLMNQYLGTLGNIKKFIFSAEQELLANGFTSTYFNRRRHIPKIHSTDKLEQWAAKREGVNHKVQGTNADIIKLAMIKIRKDIKALKLKSLLIIQVHDELVFDIYPGEEDTMIALVKNAMETVVKFIVPMPVDAKLGTSWADAH